MKARQPAQLRSLRALVVMTLVVLTAQGWFGDTVNIFIVPAEGTSPPPASLSGFLHAVESLQPSFFLMWHTFEGLVLVALAIAVLAFSLMWSKARGVHIWSTLGLLQMLSAAWGGYRFVLSGFSDGASSAQMGGSFIAAYACYFLTLYCLKSS